MNDLCKVIREMVIPNFLNIRTSIKTYDRDAVICGSPCWRWAYHALHSADKWFINPCEYEEPSFHTGMLNGQTALNTGKFPMWVSQADQYVDDGIFFGRYREGRITK